MTLQDQQLSVILEQAAQKLDISPSDYKRAVDNYTAVAKWLEEGFPKGYPGSTAGPEVYPQGSMRLGTVVRPLKDGKDADFDVDLVCELEANKSDMSPEQVKHQVGERLAANDTYEDKLDDEGKRCWTLEYAHKDDIGFHMDILPCLRDLETGTRILVENIGNPDTDSQYTGSTIALTDKELARIPVYEWRTSNPRGYAKWFENRNSAEFERIKTGQKQLLLESNREIYANISNVPDQLVRTPLQQTIQILKRDRDCCFKNEPDKKPISIIITTLCARLYRGERDLYGALKSIVLRLRSHAGLVDDPNTRLDESISSLGLIRRVGDRWYIPNPVNPAENFADRWHENSHAKAKAFFQWVEQLHTEIIEGIASQSSATGVVRTLAGVLGTSGATVLVPRRPPSAEQPEYPKVRISNPSKPWAC